MSTSLPERPITILVAALGGEGGGVLADWLVAAATAEDFPIQSTSIPGVAQRTGATTYYLELYPARRAALGGRRPVLALTPAPGNVDVMVASELLEAGRAMQNGYVSPDRTTLIASTHRVYATVEKTDMGDGRFDGARILKAAESLARQAVIFDMDRLARESGTVINAVLFGALAGSGALPISRARCEQAIESVGKGVSGSLKGFALGWAHASGEARQASPEDVKRWQAKPLERVSSSFPGPAQPILSEGAARCADFQDAAYASLYLDRLEPVAKLDREGGGGPGGFRLTTETGRFLALWMCYEDVIRVADLKTRASRYARIRDEVLARPGEPLHVTEFLKPGAEEIASILPPSASRAFLGWARKRGKPDSMNRGLYVKTTSVHGFLMLRALAALRPLRRRTARYAEEQSLIERWLAAVRGAAPVSPELALEIALLGRLIKGYGDTHRRGKANFLRILDTLVEGSGPADAAARAASIRAAREAALADPEGRRLENSLAAAGIAPQPPREQPIRLIRRPTAGRKAA